MNSYSIIHNEKGSAIVMALLVLCALTILGISSINTSTTEHMIARNERIYSGNFYRAESAVIEGLQALETASYDQLDDRTFTTFDWLKQIDSDLDMNDTDSWIPETDPDDPPNSADSENYTDADYAIIETGIAEGASLDMSATSSLFAYQAWGHCDSGDGKVLIEIGYKKRH